jgi:hypothetical protein
MQLIFRDPGLHTLPLGKTQESRARRIAARVKRASRRMCNVAFDGEEHQISSSGAV